MRRRILLLVVGMTTLVVLAFAVPLAVLTHNVIGEQADKSIAEQARGIAASLRTARPSRSQLAAYVTRQIRDTGHPVSVRLPDGEFVGSTPADGGGNPAGGGAPSDAPRPPEGNGPRPIGANDNPPQVTSAAGGTVAFAIAPTPAGFNQVRVYLADSKRYDGIGSWYLLIVGVSVGLLVLGAGAGELSTRRITRPLVRTAHTAQQLALGDTSARAPTDGPREVAEVGTALNRLADRIDELIAEERETVADLSHRLRTPLTTLRLEAEALRDPAEAERIGTRVSDLERMLSAVIRAARRPEREGRIPTSDASAVVRERVEFWSALTDEQGRHSDITVPDGPLRVRASAEDLAAALDALLENVVAHTAEGTAFTVTLERTDEGARLVVADVGTGIPHAAEVRGRSDRGSTGLGLDIARRCAEGAGGSMAIGSGPSGGAVITLLLHSP
ncbi:MAG TPA: HAMP domain-containing sensor histidine kinase [Jatrophihabitans sp.]|jgi:signal transduction histidine kinase